MDMVPPTVERRVNGDDVSVQLWVENMRTIKRIQELKLQSPNPQSWNYQVRRQRVFDNLIANIDENGGNLLIDPDWNVVLVDHSRCFAVPKMPFEMTRIDRPFFDRLKALDAAAVKKTSNGWIEPAAINSLLARRDEIVKTFEKLARQKGEAQVFEP